jgi:hypothetical protein
MRGYFRAEQPAPSVRRRSSFCLAPNCQHSRGRLFPVLCRRDRHYEYCRHLVHHWHRRRPADHRNDQWKWKLRYTCDLAECDYHHRARTSAADTSVRFQQRHASESHARPYRHQSLQRRHRQFHSHRNGRQIRQRRSGPSRHHPNANHICFRYSTFCDRLSQLLRDIRRDR